MKIGLLTFPKHRNFGATCMSYALYTVVTRESGGDVEFIEYHHGGFAYFRDMMLWFVRKIVSAVANKDDYPSVGIKEVFAQVQKNKDFQHIFEQRDDRFIDFYRLMKYTPTIKRRELKTIDKSFDRFIVGSDQVFYCGMLNLDTSYLLDWVSGDASRRSSYSASFGLRRVPPKYKVQYKSLLERFSHISIREKVNSVEGLKQLLPRKTILTMPDPVVLLKPEEWIELESDPGIIRGPFFLVYEPFSHVRFIEKIVDEIRSENGIRIVSFFEGDGVDELNKAVGPREFIWLIRHASAVITTSFHATVFSIMFQKPFVSVVANDLKQIESQNRISDTLEFYGLLDHMVYEEKDDMISATSLNKIMPISDTLSQTITVRMASEREKGIQFLRGCLND